MIFYRAPQLRRTAGWGPQVAATAKIAFRRICDQHRMGVTGWGLVVDFPGVLLLSQ